jgi:hypothetical protein
VRAATSGLLARKSPAPAPQPKTAKLGGQDTGLWARLRHAPATRPSPGGRVPMVRFFVSRQRNRPRQVTPGPEGTSPRDRQCAEPERGGPPAPPAAAVPSVIGRRRTTGWPTRPGSRYPPTHDRQVERPTTRGRARCPTPVHHCTGVTVLQEAAGALVTDYAPAVGKGRPNKLWCSEACRFRSLRQPETRAKNARLSGPVPSVIRGTNGTLIAQVARLPLGKPGSSIGPTRGAFGYTRRPRRWVEQRWGAPGGALSTVRNSCSSTHE